MNARESRDYMAEVARRGAFGKSTDLQGSLEHAYEQIVEAIEASKGVLYSTALTMDCTPEVFESVVRHLREQDSFTITGKQQHPRIDISWV